MCKTIYHLLFVVILLSGTAYGDVDIEKKSPEIKVFTLTAINFNKVNFIDSLELFSLYEKYLGATIQIPTLNKICSDITKYYRAKGFDFAFCRVPFQQIKGGVVKMYIVEGVIDSVRLVGDIEQSDSLINSYIKHITIGKPLDKSELHYVEKLINAVPGISVSSYTQNIPNTQKLELVFEIRQVKYFGEVYINNRGSKIIGPVQAGVSVSSNSLLGLHEYLRMHLLTTQETEELQVIDLSSSWPVGSEGSQLIAESSYVKSQPGDFLKSARINVDISTVSLAWSKPLVITANKTLLMTGGIDYYSSDTKFAGNISATDNLYKLKLSLDYTVSNNNHFSKANITFKQAIKGLNTSEITSNTPANTFLSTGREDFSAVKFDFFYRLILLKNVFLSNQIQGQYAFLDLPVSENIVFGGEIIGSAYDQAELFGDHGLGAKTRLNYQLTNAWLSAGYTQFYVQYDIAKVWNNTLDRITSGASLATGVSLRSGVFYLDLQITKPLTKIVLLEGNKAPRVFASTRLFF